MTIMVNGNKITANKATLNLLASYAMEARDKYERDDMMGLARQAQQVADDIYEALDTVGYYG